MTDRAPIPAEAFEDAVDRLDRDALAAFVGRLEAAAGGTVEVDPPVVTVDDGGDRERIYVAAGGSDSAAVTADSVGPSPDAVVVPGGGSDTDYDSPVRTAADLRHQLLYAVSPEAAESIAEEVLGVPARSTSYAPEPTPSTATGEAAADTDAGPAPGASDDRTAPGSGGTAGSGPAGAAVGPPGGSGASPTSDDEAGSGMATRGGAGIVVVGVLVAVILAVSGGVVYAAEVSPGGDAGAFAASAPVDDEGLSDADIRRRSRGPIDESGPVATATPMPGEDGSEASPATADTEAVRNVRPAPTCERSFLHVVQIQMNALKYNNDTTDDGIRTVRRFSSPSNRQTIRTFAEFVRIIESPTYSPMLSHDSVQYTPIQSSDDFAQVEVLTREDGNVTGQYYFRLRKIEGGGYDGCWMTDAVVSIPETSAFSGKVGGQSTNSTNETS